MKPGAHYSDSHLVMRGGAMELWYRYNKGNPRTKRPDESVDYYYRIESRDGIHWSKPQLIYPSDSPVVLTRTWLYRSTVWAQGGALRMMVSYRLPGQKWYLTPTALSVQQWQAACKAQKGIVLKAPAASPAQKLGGGRAKAGTRTAPRSLPPAPRKNGSKKTARV